MHLCFSGRFSIIINAIYLAFGNVYFSLKLQEPLVRPDSRDNLDAMDRPEVQDHQDGQGRLVQPETTVHQDLVVNREQRDHQVIN